ncbi:hypothetical protein PYW07_003546 [Mythimna separata]|uniref:Coilin n=1 Tax=Mythimna separata TaxID=271217 RepID=A0AAD7YN08_MYTSE|nr:hypothetical protein PYW07_003546 [Mythimna separata]
MVKYKESESESDAEHGVEARFRVRVCMRRFYGDGDVRARAYVCVAPRRRVAWLQRRLRRLFALPPVRLLSRGHLLPPQEPLALLQPDDPVEVVPADAEPDDTADVRHFVDSVHEVQMATVEELEPSPPPVSPDDLMASKRQALSMLDQYCGEPAVKCATDAPRARRKRVRRRRRVPRAADLDGGAEAPPAGVSAASLSAAEAARAGGSAASLSDAEERSPARRRSLVLRDELHPRAPRVVRSLTP